MVNILEPIDSKGSMGAILGDDGTPLLRAT